MNTQSLHNLLPYKNFNLFIKETNFNHLSINAIEQVIKFRLSITDSNGSLLLKNNPVGNIPPTPYSRDLLYKNDVISENSLISIASLLGDCISYIQESKGQIINNFFPIKQLESSFTSDSSDSELELHTENAFHLYSPDYLILLCLRQDSQKQAITYVSSINQIKKHLTEIQINYFFKTKSNFLSDYSETTKNCRVDLNKNMNIIYGSMENMLFRFDPDFMYSNDNVAMQKLEELKLIAWKCAIPIYLEQGDILIIDNKRTSHARSKFIAKYDGSDRWIQRVFIVKDREKIISENNKNERLLDLR